MKIINPSPLYPTNEELVVIHKWQIQLCEGNFCAAALISFFERLHFNLHKSTILQEIADSIMNVFGQKNTILALKYLEKKHIISSKNNSIARYNFNTDKQYVFHPEYIRQYFNGKNN